MNREGKLTPGKLAERFSYGCGDFGCNIIYTAMSAFLLFYYTDYAGVSAFAVGSIMMVSRLFDGISDIVMGVIVDRTKIQVRKGKAVAAAHVHTLCHIRHPAVLGAGFLVCRAKAGVCVHYI